jgi:hypothetical protein
MNHSEWNMKTTDSDYDVSCLLVLMSEEDTADGLETKFYLDFTTVEMK